MERTRVSQASDLAVLLPYMFGFHPHDSVVVVALKGKQIGVLQRHDLIPDDENPRSFAQDLVQRAIAHEASAVVVVGYEEAKGASDPLRRAITAQARARRLPVLESIVVRDGRWYAPECRAGCCPGGGRDLLPPDRVPAVASFVLRGCVPLTDRQEVSRQVTPGTGRLVGPGLIAATAERVLAQIDEAGGRAGLTVDGPAWDDLTGRSIARAWASILRPSPQTEDINDLDEAVIAVALGSLVDRQWRDALMGALAPGSMPTERVSARYARDARCATRHCPWSDTAQLTPLGIARAPIDDVERDDVAVGAVTQRLAALIRRVDPGDAVPLLVVLAHLSWWRGDGARAASCLEQALTVEPDYALATMMYQLVTSGVPLKAIA